MEKQICPICGKEYEEYPALSRKDNHTEICSECGQQEALEAFMSWKGENENEREN